MRLFLGFLLIAAVAFFIWAARTPEWRERLGHWQQELSKQTANQTPQPTGASTEWQWFNSYCLRPVGAESSSTSAALSKYCECYADAAVKALTTNDVEYMRCFMSSHVGNETEREACEAKYLGTGPLAKRRLSLFLKILQESCSGKVQN